MTSNNPIHKTEPQLRIKFKDVLLKLAKQIDFSNEQEVETIYKELEELYYNDGGEEFRHFYSDIFTIISKINSDANLGNLDNLAISLEQLYGNYEKYYSLKQKPTIDIKRNLSKLYDHISLETARISLAEDLKRDITSEKSIENITNKTVELEKDIETTKTDIETTKTDMKSRIEKMGREHVAILGIFAAIVITFTGGISFTTSVLDNIHKASIYKTIFVTLLIAFVLINILYILFLYINKIVNNDDVRANFELPLFVNGAIVFAILITFLAWHDGTVEKRNKEFNKQTAIESPNDNTTKRKTNDNNAIIQIIQQ